MLGIENKLKRMFRVHDVRRTSSKCGRRRRCAAGPRTGAPAAATKQARTTRSRAQARKRALAGFLDSLGRDSATSIKTRQQRAVGARPHQTKILVELLQQGAPGRVRQRQIWAECDLRHF